MQFSSSGGSSLCLSRAVWQEILSPVLFSSQQGKVAELLSVGWQGWTVKAQTQRYNVKLKRPSAKSFQVESSFKHLLSWRSSTPLVEKLVTRLQAMSYIHKISKNESILSLHKKPGSWAQLNSAQNCRWSVFSLRKQAYKCHNDRLKTSWMEKSFSGADRACGAKEESRPVV